MTKNTEDNEIYVMADDEAFVPPVSGFLLPWWIFVLPFLLVGGLAIAYITNANKYKTTTNPGIPSVENPRSNGSSTNNNVTNNSNSNNSSTNNNTTNNSNANNSSTNNNTTNNSQANLPSNNNSPKSLEITEKVYFTYKSTEVIPSEAPKLQSFLSKLPDTTGTLIIEGHSDHVGSHEYNENLAQQRAEQVANKLRELGLDQKYQVKIESWGETKPHKDNQTEQGRALNRRVVLSFTNAN